MAGPRGDISSTCFNSVLKAYNHECKAGIDGSVYFFLLPTVNKQEHTSTLWVLFSVFLGAVAMLCKEQGITVLVRKLTC